MIHTDVTQGHNTGINAVTTGAAHNDHTPPIEATAIDLAMTQHVNHITDHPHIDVLQLTNPESTLTTILLIFKEKVHLSADHEENHTTKRTQG